MSEIAFRGDIKVELVPDATCGSERVAACAAWAVHPDRVPADRNDTPEGHERVNRACVKGGHNTPFEHGLMTVYVEAPGVVWWQWTRQRFHSIDTEDFSFSLESGRYKHLDPEFYLPPEWRPCAEPAGFKPMRPVLEQEAEAFDRAGHEIELTCRYAWERYKAMLNAGIAREVARLCLPNWALYCDGWVSAKPASWLTFFGKRAKTKETAVPTFPQWEIENAAQQCETLFAERWPLTYRAWVANGRAGL
jgi:thymidylate synthase (FAD)